MNLRRRFAIVSLGLAVAALAGGCYDSSATYRDRDYATRHAKEQDPNADNSQGGPDSRGDMAGKGRAGEHKEAIRSNLHK